MPLSLAELYQNRIRIHFLPSVFYSIPYLVYNTFILLLSFMVRFTESFVGVLKLLIQKEMVCECHNLFSASVLLKQKCSVQQQCPWLQCHEYKSVVKILDDCGGLPAEFCPFPHNATLPPLTSTSRVISREGVPQIRGCLRYPREASLTGQCRIQGLYLTTSVRLEPSEEPL